MPFKTYQDKFAFAQAVKNAHAEGRLGKDRLESYRQGQIVPWCSIGHGAHAIGVTLEELEADDTTASAYVGTEALRYRNVARVVGLTRAEASYIMSANDNSSDHEQLERVMDAIQRIPVGKTVS